LLPKDKADQERMVLALLKLFVIKKFSLNNAKGLVISSQQNKTY
jgi:hypothetical protein